MPSLNTFSGNTFTVGNVFPTKYVFRRIRVYGGPSLFDQDGSISGIVKVQGSVASRVVEVYDQETLTLLNSTVSGIDGTYTVDKLPKNRALRVLYKGNTGERDITLRDITAI